MLCLHNQLLVEDGLEDWSQDTIDDVDFDVPQVFERLKKKPIFVDQSFIAGPLDEDTIVDEQHGRFREKLIAHFNYRWNLPKGHQNSIAWPSRNGLCENEI